MLAITQSVTWFYLPLLALAQSPMLYTPKLFLWFVIHRAVVWSPASQFDFVYIFLVSLSINHKDSLIGLYFQGSLKCEMLCKCSRLLLLCDSSLAIFFPEWKLKRNYLPFTRVNMVNSVISNHSSIKKKKKNPLFHRTALLKRLNFSSLS